MLGIITNGLVFDFKDQEGLARALTAYGNKNRCSIVVIADQSSGVIRALISDNNLVFSNGLSDNTVYKLFGTNNQQAMNLGRGSLVDDVGDWEMAVDFTYRVQILPETIDF